MDAAKARLAPLRAAMADFAETPVKRALGAAFAPDAALRLCHPIGTLTGPDALWQHAYAPLFRAMPDLERRDFILIAGQDGDGANWIGAAGHYMGTLMAPFLGIPPTGHLAHMRYHEFFRIDAGRIVEMQAIWDIPELMMQARAWPMAPSLGREGLIPGPATQDGLAVSGDGSAALQTVMDMLTALTRHPSQGGPEVMEIPRYWHPRFNWYGPAGIGTARGLAGFRNWHQIPFLAAMPDRGQDRSGTHGHFFAEGAYAAVTGWPNMRQTLTGGGWLGLPPTGKPITLRSLDFWRIEAGLIRENWVLVDLLDAFAQTGVDVMARLGEFNKARNLAPVDLRQQI